MLLRLQKRLAETDLDAILGFAEGLGYRTRFLDEGKTLLDLEGPGRPEHRSQIEELHGVASVLDASDAPELHARHSEGSGNADGYLRVEAAGAAFGAGSIGIIAGPCAVEGEESLLEIARAVKALGAGLLRGGAYKPRTSPYSFQGLGREGLEILAHVRAATGIGIVTEVLDPRDVEAVAEIADVIQIGARSMSNFPLLREMGQLRKPILLKRGFGARVRELLMAAEHVLAGGNENVILCERGVRGFDSVTRNVLDVGAVAHLKGATHLPVIVDPSHAAGRPDLVRPLARAGIAVGADGLIIEVHPRPMELHSDADQAISLDAFAEIVGDVRALATLDGRELVQSGALDTAHSSVQAARNGRSETGAVSVATISKSSN